MYVTKLEIKNIKCFDELSIDFHSAGDATNWVLILGDNGLGKTTILRSIAMSLCGTTNLLDETDGEWLRVGTRHGEIRLEVKPSNENERPFSVTTFFERTSLKAETKIRQEFEPNENEIPWDQFFVCGYGAGRGVAGADTYSRYSVTDSVYTLFRYDQTLQNSELMVRRIKDNISVRSYRRLFHWIDNILMLPMGATKLEIGGLTVSGPWGKSMPVGALSDGHQATINWVVDLFGWALLHNKDAFQGEMSGIVLLDEIEQHLHPKWQRSIIPLLKSMLPKVQFIITTHSPLVAANTGRTSLGKSEIQLYYLRQEGKTSKSSKVEENLEDLNAAQVLSSEAFGHIFSTNPTIEIFLRKASTLAAKDERTQGEETKYKQIKDMLKETMFPRGMTLIERIVEREYYSELEEKVEDFNKILDEDKE